MNMRSGYLDGVRRQAPGRDPSRRRAGSTILGAMKLYLAGPLFTAAERASNAQLAAALRILAALATLEGRP
jgi:hypothetical protein